MLPRDCPAASLQTEAQQLECITASASTASNSSSSGESGTWRVLLPRTRLGPGAQHFFTAAANQLNNVSAKC